MNPFIPFEKFEKFLLTFAKKENTIAPIQQFASSSQSRGVPSWIIGGSKKSVLTVGVWTTIIVMIPVVTGQVIKNNVFKEKS